jgi:hypothetical protein
VKLHNQDYINQSLTLTYSRIYRIPSLDQKLEWALSLVYHIFVVGGVALAAAGSAKLQKHQQPVEKAESIVKAGIAILTICWAALVGGAIISFITPSTKSAVGRGGTTVSSLYLRLEKCS